MYPGIIPILHSSGFMIPGQFGPIKRDFVYDFMACFTLTISCYGIPSVIQTIKSISASTASRIASAANGGGTYITDAVQPVSFLAS
jgi:hypothetical protein